MSYDLSVFYSWQFVVLCLAIVAIMKVVKSVGLSVRPDLMNSPGGSGGGEDLGQTLANGNTTDGYDIVLSAGDVIESADGYVTINDNLLVNGHIDVNRNRIVEVAVPIEDQDAATKAYVDGYVLTPNQLSANEDNYNPGSLYEANILRLSSLLNVSISGIEAVSFGKVMKVLINVGSNSITLLHESNSSDSDNRFIIAGSSDFTLEPNESVNIFYDVISSMWRLV